jgi:hypothetical protein
MAAVKIPEAMNTPRFQADRFIDITGEIPLIDPSLPANKQVRKRLVAKCQVFNLLDGVDLKAYQDVWQAIADKSAVFCEKSEPTIQDGKMLAFLRWGAWEFIAPTT